MKKLIYILFATSLLIACSNSDTPTDLTVHTYTHTDNEMDLFNKINHFRDSIGVNELVLIDHVSFKCMEHNEYMIQNNVINHDYFYDRSTNIQNIYHCVDVGEILGYNYQTNKSVLSAWLNSSCHDTIIRSEFIRIGLSITENPINNRKYYTVIFLD